MLKTKNLLLVFIPAILLVAMALFIRFVQLENNDGPQKNTGVTPFNLPIFPKDPILGQKKAPKTLILFSDFACSACKIQDTLLEEVLQKHPSQVKIIWKGLPVTRFPYNSRQAHLYAYCTNEQERFSDFKKLAFVNQENLSELILKTITTELALDTKQIENCLAGGEAEQHVGSVEQISRLLGIQSVPTIFLDNQQIIAPSSVLEWEQLLGLTNL